MESVVKTSTPPPCIEKFTFSNVIIDALGLTRYPYVLDAATYFSYNPIQFSNVMPGIGSSARLIVTIKICRQNRIYKAYEDYYSKMTKLNNSQR